MASIELEIDNENWDTFKFHFLLIHPNQTLDWDTPLSDDAWITHRVMLFARGAYEKGVRQVFEQTSQAPTVPDIIH